MPAGLLDTVPVPAPAVETVRTKVGVKVAVTVVAAETVTTHDPVPVQPPPLQPVKAEFALGVAVIVTAVPLVKLAVQLAPQLIPAGLLVTVPVPVPAVVIVRTKAPLPVTSRAMVSPSAVKLTFAIAVAPVVGVKRTVTAWLARVPTRLNGLPEKMLNGAGVDTVPETVPPTVFDTVKG